MVLQQLSIIGVLSISGTQRSVLKIIVGETCAHYQRKREENVTFLIIHTMFEV